LKRVGWPGPYQTDSCRMGGQGIKEVGGEGKVERGFLPSTREVSKKPPTNDNMQRSRWVDVLEGKEKVQKKRMLRARKRGESGLNSP